MSATPITTERKKKIVVKTTVYSYTLLIRHLTLHDSSVNQLVEVCGLHRTTVANMLRAFYKLDVIHISGWLPDRKKRYNIPVYRWGQGISVIRPRQTAAQRQQARRNRLVKQYQLESSRKQSLAAIEKGLKSELTKTKPATSAGLGYSVFVQASLGLDGSCSE